MAGKVSLNQALNSFSAIHGCFFVMAVLSHGFVPDELEALSHGLVPELLDVLSHGLELEDLEVLSHGLVPEVRVVLSHGLVPELLPVFSHGRDILILLVNLPLDKASCLQSPT